MMKTHQQSQAKLWCILMKPENAVALVLGLATAFAVGFVCGTADTRKECLPAQQHERLIYSEQRVDSTVCQYVEGVATYGHEVKYRRNHD